EDWPCRRPARGRAGRDTTGATTSSACWTSAPWTAGGAHDSVARAMKESDHEPLPTADEALARLRAGNQRFLRGRARFPTVRKEVLAALAKRQRPFATILGCSDSRVPPELVFDASFGDLFIVRVAGNVISPEVMGSLQYAGLELRTPLFVVL